MMELIDQRDPNNRVYRCDQCGHSAVSTVARARDGYAWAATPGTPTPFGWVRHVCQQGDIAAFRAVPAPVVPPKPKRTRAVTAPAPSTLLPVAKVGRPRKAKAIPGA